MVLEPAVRPVINPVVRAVQGSSVGVASPGSLFPSGTQGVWYDPSDASTLFSDTAGTTPSPTPGGGALSVVGLMLDKSQGLALGSELVTNGDFSNGTTGWSPNAGASLSVVNGELRVANTTATFGNGYQVLSTVVGALYKVVGTLRCNVGTSSANLQIKNTLGGANLLNLSTTSTSNVTLTGYFFATATSTYVVGLNNNIATEVSFYDNISVKAVAGNHAISYNTTTARPELSARVNLLTYSEQFDNAAWQPNTSTVTANTTVAPNGTTTADTLVPNSGVAINIAFAGIFTAGASSYLTRAAATALQNVPYTASFYVKAGNTLTHIQFRNGTNADLTGTSYNIIVRLADGFVVSADGTATSQGVGNGWYRITLTFTPVAGSYYSGFWFWNDTNIACNGSQNVLVWGAQLIATNQFPANTYQRIADQYTYDSNGFPRYFIANGTATGMYTPNNLNLSGTDKVTVFAGVRKQSDAAAGVLAELSNNYNNNANTFAVFIPSGANTQVSSGISNGSGLYNQAYYTDSAAPISTVNSTAYNKALTADQVVFIRKNGSDQTLTRSLNNNTGQTNFGSYPLNIGVRSATATPSLFFNGYIYSLIVVGAASTAAQISSTESWINVKEGGVY